MAEIQYDYDKQNHEKIIEGFNKKIPNTNELIKTIDYNTKIAEVENKIPSVIGLVTATAVNTKPTEIENKILDITNLATKAALNINTTVIESHFNNTQEFKRVTKISSDVIKKESEKRLASKTEVDNAFDLENEIRKKTSNI